MMTRDLFAFHGHASEKQAVALETVLGQADLLCADWVALFAEEVNLGELIIEC